MTGYAVTLADSVRKELYTIDDARRLVDIARVAHRSEVYEP